MGSISLHFLKISVHNVRYTGNLNMWSKKIKGDTVQMSTSKTHLV